MKPLKYVLFSTQRAEALQYGLLMGGLFSWHRAFEEYGGKGEMNDIISKDFLEQFDVVHVNYTPGNHSYIPAIKKELGESDTKIIANVDHAIDLWNGYDLHTMKAMLSMADMVFAVESHAARALEIILNTPYIPVIPHPIDVKGLKTLRRSERTPNISCQFHRYHETWSDYAIALWNFRGEFPDIGTIIMNVEVPEGQKRISVPLQSYFTHVQQRLPYPQYAKVLSEMVLNIDMSPDHTYGRGVVEAAALGVPTICSTTIEAAENLVWDDWTVNPGDTASLQYDIVALLNNDDEREEMAKIGMEGAEGYSYKSSYERMVAILETQAVIL